MARAPTQKEIAAFVVGHGIADFVSGGKLSLVERNALWKVLKKLGPITGRAAVGTGRLLGASAVGAAAPFATNPYVVGTALGAGALVSPPGQALLEAAEERGRMDRIRFEQGLTDAEMIMREEFNRLLTEGPRPSPGRVPPGFLQKPKRRKSAYNSAVSKGLKALKKSSYGGKKGTLTKKAFGFVAKTVSKLRKGKKVSSKGASGVVKRALPGVKSIKVRK